MSFQIVVMRHSLCGGYVYQNITLLYSLHAKSVELFFFKLVIRVLLFSWRLINANIILNVYSMKQSVNSCQMYLLIFRPIFFGGIHKSRKDTTKRDTREAKLTDLLLCCLSPKPRLVLA